MIKFVRSLVAMVAAMFVCSVGFAKEIWVPIDVHSSGPSIYACNAGLKHPAPQLAQICHLQNTTQPCAPGQPFCKCTSTNGGAYLMDYMRYEIAPWVDNNKDWGTYSLPQTAQAGKEQYANAVDPKNSLAYSIKNIHINLGSEQYGACYFVDICYRGPQIDYWNPASYLNVNANFNAYGEVTLSGLDPETGTVVIGEDDYKKLARPKGRATLHCDTQGRGNNVYAANSSGMYDTFVNDIDWNALQVGQAGTSDYVVGAGASFSAITTSTQTLLPQNWISYNSGKTPRFCVVRYEFCESEGAERKWARHDARFMTFTRIEEPAE